MGLISNSAFQDAFWNAHQSVFRLESLQHYAGDPNHARFERGESWQPTESKGHWVDLVSRRCAAGVAMQRVRQVEEPWSSFTEFELTWSYPPNVAAGEDIRVVAWSITGEPTSLPELDFWLFDETELWWLGYSPEGELTSVDRDRSPQALQVACQWRRRALAASVPLAQYVAQGQTQRSA